EIYEVRHGRWERETARSDATGWARRACFSDSRTGRCEDERLTRGIKFARSSEEDTVCRGQCLARQADGGLHDRPALGVRRPRRNQEDLKNLRSDVGGRSFVWLGST